MILATFGSQFLTKNIVDRLKINNGTMWGNITQSYIINQFVTIVIYPIEIIRKRMVQ